MFESLPRKSEQSSSHTRSTKSKWLNLVVLIDVFITTIDSNTLLSAGCQEKRWQQPSIISLSHCVRLIQINYYRLYFDFRENIFRPLFSLFPAIFKLEFNPNSLTITGSPQPGVAWNTMLTCYVDKAEVKLPGVITPKPFEPEILPNLPLHQSPQVSPPIVYMLWRCINRALIVQNNSFNMIMLIRICYDELVPANMIDLLYDSI